MRYIKTDGRLWYKQIVSGVLWSGAILFCSCLAFFGVLMAYAVLMTAFDAGWDQSMIFIGKLAGGVVAAILAICAIGLIHDWATH